MNAKNIRSALAACLFLMTPALVIGACGDDDDDGACTENSYNCAGSVLQRCIDGAFVDQEDCGMNECEADVGHCHEEGEGGHGHGGDEHGGHGHGGDEHGGHGGDEHGGHGGEGGHGGN